MDVHDADSARAWLRAWGGRPRLGILRAVLDGVRLSRALSHGREARRKDAAVRVLEEHLESRR